MSTDKKTRVKSPAAEAATAMSKVADMLKRETRAKSKVKEMEDLRIAYLEGLSPEAKIFYDKLTA